ncbi:sneaky [Carabus blaptoides fortunei]
MIIVDLDFTEYSALLMEHSFVYLFSGRAGRRILKTLVIAYIVAGPITNLANNGKEVARVFSCTTSLTFNLTKTRFELMFKPFQQAILSMKADSNEIKDTVRSIRDLTAPITGELEGEEEMKKIKEENDYLDDLQQDSKRSNEIDKKYDTHGETTGKHDMMLEVRGTGLIASILRSIVKGFNIKKRIKIVRSNAQCLPQHTLLPNYYLYKIYGTYLVIWLLIFSQGYILRLRRVICAFYYRKREKKRILFLYNETLKRRIGFFRYMKKEVKKKVREQRLEENLNLFVVLRVRCPRACEWLRIFAMSRRKCIICTEPEPCFKKNISGNFSKCPNPTCHVVYCLECWHDLGETCYACAVASPNASDFEDSDSDIN